MTMQATVKELIKTNEIHITAGEGEGFGTTEIYDGKRTIRAIKMRLTRERCGEARWAKAKVVSHTIDFGDVFVNVETGEYCL